MTKQRKTVKRAAKSPTQRLYSGRFGFVMIVLLALPIALLGRLGLLQVVPEADQGFEFLQDQGDARSIREVAIPAHRGMITDRNGEPLAISTPMTTIIANPRLLLPTGGESPQEVEEVNRLAVALELDAGELLSRLKSVSSRRFVYLKRRMPPNEGESVLALNIRGVSSITEYQRYYPAGEVAAHIVGFTGADDRGQEGIELLRDSELTGTNGSRRVARDLLGNVIRDLGVISSPEMGQDIQLSIDMRLQYIAYRELKAAVIRHQAEGGSIVVVDVATGEVLAMANQPSYNPNNRASFIPGTTRNRALTDIFEPGSTVKPLSIGYALETGLFTPDSIIDTSPGWIRVGSKTLLDPVNYGEISLTRIITKSSQVGTTKVALQLDPNELRDRLYQYGLGQKTATEFPGESAGTLPSQMVWSDIGRANVAFGYGLSVTATQLASAYATIGNGGVHVPVHLERNGVDYRAMSNRVLSPEISQQIVEMMATVTTLEGSGKNARVPGYNVAGKTGTAHKVGAEGYMGASYRSLFAGVAPVENPRLAVVVVIDEPTAGGHFGGEVAAPAFGKVVADAMRLLNVAPSTSTSID